MRVFQTALGIAVACLTVAAPAVAQTAPQEKPLMVEDVFKNVQVLKGIPVNQFMDTMGFFAAALGLNCTGCHVNESLQDWQKFAEDVPRKRAARSMIRMVEAINKAQYPRQIRPGARRRAASRRPHEFCRERHHRRL